MIVARGWRGGEMGILVKGYKLSVIRLLSSENLMYIMLTLFKVLYPILDIYWEYILNVLTKKKNVSEVIGVLVNLIRVIISQCICISHYQFVF